MSLGKMIQTGPTSLAAIQLFLQTDPLSTILVQAELEDSMHLSRISLWQINSSVGQYMSEAPGLVQEKKY